LESLKLGAQEMLAAEIDFEPEAYMTAINVPDPEWASIQQRQRRWTVDPIKGQEKVFWEEGNLGPQASYG
jgi:hypothetical protein